jgi:hypothetical protein
MEGLIFQALRASGPSFQQSYPQFFGMTPKAHSNQALSAGFEKFPNRQIHQIIQRKHQYREHTPLA